MKEAFGMTSPFWDEKEMFIRMQYVKEFRELFGHLTYLENLKFIKDKLVQKALNYIYENYWDSFELKDIAAYVGLSPACLSLRLKKKTLYSFRDIVLKIRISHAVKMLLETDELVESVAYSCGFGTRRTFNREFKQHTGLVPSEFRTLYNTVELIFVGSNKFNIIAAEDTENRNTSNESPHYWSLHAIC